MPHGNCELCCRSGLELTRHHLIPRSRHRKGQIRRSFPKSELSERIAMLCRSCHRFIHRTLSEAELASSFNTISDLQRHPEIAKFIGWIADKPAGLAVRSAKPRRRSESGNGIQR